MVDVITTVATPLLVVLIAGFLIVRFGFLAGREVGGRIPFVTGAVLLLVVSLWNLAKLASDYSDWFVAGAYPLINFSGYLVAVLGLVLVVVGLALYADYWQERRTEVEERLGRLSILDNLQHDSRQPYHVLEMLNISLREILVQYPMAAGAVFLVNRARRQFVLTSSSGLHKEEVAYLEYYPLERNAVSQAVELGDPMLLTQFDFIDRSGARVPSRFKSILVLPLISGMEKIGGLLLFSEEEQFFGAQDIRYLSPVSQWLAERLKSARLARLLTQAENQRENSTARFADLTSRLGTASREAASSDPLTGFCTALVGLADSESVHLCGLKQGVLVFHGGSEPLFDVSENFRTALVDGLDRGKPLIINQESDDASQGGHIVQSSLLYPVPSSGADALLLVKSGRPFSVDDTGLKLLESFTQLAGLVVRMDEDNRLRLTRRKGFEVVLEILQSESVGSDATHGVEYFLEAICRVFPRKSICLAFVADGDAGFRAMGLSGRPEKDQVSDWQLEALEGGVGAIAETGRSLFMSGKSAVVRHLESYTDQHRSAFQRLFGERGLPEFLAYCPITDGRSSAVALIASFTLEDSERGEWERLLTLAAGLCSLRLTMSRPNRIEVTAEQSPKPIEVSGVLLNELNNHLAAVIGTAELVAQDDRLSEEARAKLRLITQQAEQAAGVARRTLTTGATPRMESPQPDQISQDIRRELDRVRVAGNLYMAGHRPREIELKLGPVPPVALPSLRFGELFRTLLDRFAALADDDDVFTVATYIRDRYAYLDISRHRRNFPPVAPIAGFGRYMASEEAFRNRPADVYLAHVLDTGTGYAVDSEGASPAYLSFQFPLLETEGGSTQPVKHDRPRLLAIDDQAVILDLISAMGQSLGYEVRTASTGEEGLRLVEQESFAAVLTDLALPGVSGLEVARQVSRQHPGTPVILVTGWSTPLRAEELAEAGVTEVVNKPFRIEQLTAVVRAVVSSRVRS
jgi:CheY-like chemotaxis protein